MAQEVNTLSQYPTNNNNNNINTTNGVINFNNGTTNQFPPYYSNMNPYFFNLSNQTSPLLYPNIYTNNANDSYNNNIIESDTTYQTFDNLNSTNNVTNKQNYIENPPTQVDNHLNNDILNSKLYSFGDGPMVEDSEQLQSNSNTLGVNYAILTNSSDSLLYASNNQQLHFSQSLYGSNSKPINVVESKQNTNFLYPIIAPPPHAYMTTNSHIYNRDTPMVYQYGTSNLMCPYLNYINHQIVDINPQKLHWNPITIYDSNVDSTIQPLPYNPTNYNQFQQISYRYDNNLDTNNNQDTLCTHDSCENCVHFSPQTNHNELMTPNMNETSLDVTNDYQSFTRNECSTSTIDNNSSFPSTSFQNDHLNIENNMKSDNIYFYKGSKRGKKRRRMSYSRTQLYYLENEYRKSHFLQREKRFEISSFLGLNERQVKIWFQNRRMKDKKVPTTKKIQYSTTSTPTNSTYDMNKTSESVDINFSNIDVHNDIVNNTQSNSNFQLNKVNGLVFDTLHKNISNMTVDSKTHIMTNETKNITPQQPLLYSNSSTINQSNQNSNDSPSILSVSFNHYS